MIVRPIQTEKAYRVEADRSYSFVVPADSTKQEVAKQIESQYGVKVESVRILIRKGKATKFSRGKHAYPGTTYRADKKIAYVTLAEGDSIKVFEEVSEEATDNKSTDKEGDK